MLKWLRVNNLVLVERAEIEFHSGFNVMTGETGAGKSAILHALKLLTGDKADTTLLRSGSEKGCVEALFDCSALPALEAVLATAGIDCDDEGTLVIKREITAAGRGKIFLNHQLAQRSLLQQVAALLLQIVGQHASRALLSADTHRALVDRYGGLEGSVHSFHALWQRERRLTADLGALVQSERERLRTVEALEREVAELDAARLRPGEEEELFADYSRLMNAEALAALSRELLVLTEADHKGITALLARGQRLFDKLLGLEPAMQEAAELWHNATVELAEVSHLLHHYSGRLGADPDRAASLDSRLKLLNDLKRKYGHDIDAVCAYHAAALQRLAELQQSDFTIETLQNDLRTLHADMDAAAAALTAERQGAAAAFGDALAGELRALNMPHASVDIAVTPATRGPSGDDHVEIFLTPNAGEKKIPLRLSASGGELARTLLAVQYLLAGKGGVPTLVFDEIDANIGGQTATLVGAKLHAIGTAQQVLCVTHFPQVASQAHHHLVIAKSGRAGRTLTTVTALDDSDKAPELARMSGIA